MNPKIEAITSRFNALFARREYLIKRKSAMALKRDNIETWLKLQPQVLSVLERMQSEVQRTAVIDYERLLTQAMRSILPESEGNVVLNVQLERGRPSMHVMVNRDGHAENVVFGRGGSLSNVLSAALRFIVLNRMPVRRFCVLDEPDCWLKTIRVPAFLETITNLSRASNIQTLMVTHNSDFVLQGGLSARVIEIKKNGRGQIESEIVVTDEDGSDDVQWLGADADTFDHVSDDMMDGVGIRYIRLINVMSHADTVIELSPRMNFIIGDNDIGKSVITSALKAIFYNDSDDSLIRHDMPEARIELGLEEGMTLVWQRFAEGRTRNGVYQKVGYTLLDDAGNEIAQEWGASNVPEFAQEMMGVGMLEDDIDVHISHQKTPIFLLGPDTTPSKRAKLLSIGGEMDRVRHMIDLFNKKKQDQRTLLKSVQAEIEHIDRALITLRELEIVQDKLTNLTKIGQRQAMLESNLKDQQKLLNEVDCRLKRYEILNRASLEAIEMPKLDIDPEMGRMFIQWRDKHKRYSVLSNLDDAQCPSIAGRISPDTDKAMAADYLQMAFHYKIVRVLDKLPDEMSYSRLDLNGLNAMHETYSKVSDAFALSGALKQSTEEIESVCQMQRSTRHELSTLIDEMGGQCPSCGQSLSLKDGQKHDLHHVTG